MSRLISPACSGSNRGGRGRDGGEGLDSGIGKSSGIGRGKESDQKSTEDIQYIWIDTIQSEITFA